MWFERDIINVFGPPQYVRTDQGSEFFKHMHECLVKHGILHKFTERASPWRNGRAERMVRTVKRMITAVIAAREAEDWTEILPQVALAINSAPTRGTGFSPFELFFGEKPPLLVRDYEISGETEILSKQINVDNDKELIDTLLSRKAAMTGLAKARLREYH